jgi:hypothetical protein
VGELVDHRQALDLLAFGGGVEHEVVSPHEVGVGRWKRSGPAAGDATSRTPTWQLEPCLPPQPVRAMHAESVTLAAQEDADAPVAVPWVLGRERPHGLEHWTVLGRHA